MSLQLLFDLFFLQLDLGFDLFLLPLFFVLLLKLQLGPCLGLVFFDFAGHGLLNLTLLLRHLLRLLLSLTPNLFTVLLIRFLLLLSQLLQKLVFFRLVL